MGQVYLGRSVSGRLVAVKTIKPELADDEGFRTRFAQEVAAARRVSGVFTAALVEADPDADVPWLATAYVPAPSLRELVRKCGPLPPEAVRWLAAGCAEALASIHAVGLVHLDLKPSNVLVALDGPMVIDFGVARAAGRIAFATGVGTVGTPAYMAPEQAQDASQVSAASDVFSLGATLLFAATGHPPYTGETTADVLIRLANDLPDLTGLPAELNGLVTGCLQRDPARRPSSTALLERLGQFTEDQWYLPDTALALIRQYQPGHGGDSEETAPSVPALPDKARPEASPLGSWPGLRRWPRLRTVRMRLPTWAAWSAVGAVLIAAGVILGATLTSSGSSGVPVRGSVSSGSGTGANSGSGSGVEPGPGGPPVNMQQLSAATGPSCGQPVKASPALCVNQPFDFPGSRFSVTAIGFKPHTRISLTMFYYPPPGSINSMPTVLRQFSMSANSTLWLGRFSTHGLYQVVAFIAGNRRVVAAFAIIPQTPP
jgi:serine/threonine protein kinase